MAGIYIHIPFCKKACHYCDFHFSTSLANQTVLVKAIVDEISQRKGYLKNQTIETIYFGGGTPSILNTTCVEEILTAIDLNFKVVPNAEITIEANPEDLEYSKLSELKKAKVNRLSIGIQSFIDSNLDAMNRSHTSLQAKEAVRNAQAVGFENISIDLIYGLPDLSISQWQMNLEIAIALKVQHVSSYCLTVEPKTVLQHQVKNRSITLPSENIVNKQFQELIKTLRKNGFLHYEISNFALDGFVSKHNSNYWKNEPYLGIGPSAHSFNGVHRSWNVSNNNVYIKSVSEGEVKHELEKLTDQDKFNEYIMTSLRTSWGCDLQLVSENYGQKMTSFIEKEAKNHIKNGFLAKKGAILSLTEKGKLFADKISSDLFYINK